VQKLDRAKKVVGDNQNVLFFQGVLLNLEQELLDIVGNVLHHEEDARGVV